MGNRLKSLERLAEDQLRASSPKYHAALSASAGTGKTHVLTARVLRLLLSGVDPSSILCLTFTKAGAAEMADRIHARLAHWVRLKDAELGGELAALGEDPGPEARQRARTLFARVLDAPGGLRIQTIHSFAQSLLAAFPAEAGLTPGFRPLDGREERLLARRTLGDLLVDAQRSDPVLIRDVQSLSLRLGESGAESFLLECARAPDAMEALGPREGIGARLRLVFDLPLGDIDDAIEKECCDDVFDIAMLREIGLLNRKWGTKSGSERANLCEEWIAANPRERANLLQKLHEIWAKTDGEIRSFGKGHAPQDENYINLATAAFECCARLIRIRRLATYSDCLAAGLRAGQTFAFRYSAAKRTEGVADFSDLIRWAEALLKTPGMGEWVRYKLDQRTDHILVDEAQDTNEAQWNIVGALAEEFFAGQGASGPHRTIFTVGDFKQAIFRFQGTDPRQFDLAKRHFEEKAETARESSLQIRGMTESAPPAYLNLSMDRSFRSASPILAVVDRVIGDLGHEQLGLPRRPNPHISHRSKAPGSVVLWQPLSDEAAEPDEEAGEEGWISEIERRYATKLARQIREWIENPFEIGGGGSARPRLLRPEDIMILVRRRSSLASLIVARLYAEQIPVAGIDRLLLSAPLAVKDLLAAARFALQPFDDLNLANLLVSPLFGWSQEQLYEICFRRPGALWPALKAHSGNEPVLPKSKVDKTLEGLSSILGMADFAPPYLFFETLLSGPMQGRRKLLRRLGQEARDPIEELLSSALEFESSTGPSMQHFLDWFARGDVEIVRDPSSSAEAVRLMTVHGSKGLQSPVVILADACVNPARQRGNTSIRLEIPGLKEAVPFIRPRKEELAEPIRTLLEEQERLERHEHWRLLYVGMTRAEDRLYISGALSPLDRGKPPKESWYQALDTSMSDLGCEWEEDPIWGKSRRFGDAEVRIKKPKSPAKKEASALPEWIHRPAPAESRPPRPLAPSAIEEDDVPNPPPSPTMRKAAERGRLLHQLFERLPDIAADQRFEIADRWLHLSAGVTDIEFRKSIVADACRVISDPRFARIFGPEALAEAPLAAVTPDGSVISGTVDRLFISDDRIELVDFKTGNLVPETLDHIPRAHLKQMAAYAAALKVIFPGREIETALLYTSGPKLHILLPSLLQSDLAQQQTATG